MENGLANIENYLTLEQFYKLTFNFCENNDLTRFINIQVGQAKKIHKA